jgi:hypothetical protein
MQKGTLHRRCHDRDPGVDLFRTAHRRVFDFLADPRTEPKYNLLILAANDHRRCQLAQRIWGGGEVGCLGGRNRALERGRVLASLWFTVDSDAWRVVQNQYSPVRVVDHLGLIAAVDVLGLKRTIIAKLAFGRSGLLPIAASSPGTFAGAVPLSAVRVIPVITCILYLVSARLGHRSASVTPRDSGRRCYRLNDRSVSSPDEGRVLRSLN